MKPRARFTTRLDLTLTPLIELVLLLLSAGSVALVDSWGQRWGVAGWLVVGYLFLNVWTLLVLKLLRTFFPVKEGVYSLAGNARTVYLWNLYGFLCVMNLSLFYTSNLLPIPLRRFFLQLLGCQIAGGLVVVSGVVTDPHLVTIEEGVILGDECYVSPHALVSLRSGDALVIKRIHFKAGCVVGARSVISPGVTVGEGAMIAPHVVVPMNEQVPDDSNWSRAAP